MLLNVNTKYCGVQYICYYTNKVDVCQWVFISSVARRFVISASAWDYLAKYLFVYQTPLLWMRNYFMLRKPASPVTKVTDSLRHLSLKVSTKATNFWLCFAFEQAASDLRFHTSYLNLLHLTMHDTLRTSDKFKSRHSLPCRESSQNW